MVNQKTARELLYALEIRTHISSNDLRNRAYHEIVELNKATREYIKEEREFQAKLHGRETKKQKSLGTG